MGRQRNKRTTPEKPAITTNQEAELPGPTRKLSFLVGHGRSGVWHSLPEFVGFRHFLGSDRFSRQEVLDVLWPVHEIESALNITLGRWK